MTVEPTDDAGTAVVPADGGDTTVPGGDVDLDGTISTDDLESLLQSVFSGPA